jgi:hypothetical protein
MNCTQCEELFGGYLEGLLDDEKKTLVENHLAGCPSCRGALDETRRLVGCLSAQARSIEAEPLALLVMDRIVRRQAHKLRSRRTTRLVSAVAGLAAAAALVGYLIGNHAGSPAYADDLREAGRQMKAARTMTWKTRHYRRRRATESAAEKRFYGRFDAQVVRHYFRAPDRLRNERIENGQTTEINIFDVTSGKRLLLVPRKKKAIFYLNVEPPILKEGPFADVYAAIRRNDLVWIGRKQIAGHEANGFRWVSAVGPENESWSEDIWIDVATKRLSMVQLPGVDLLDPDSQGAASADAGPKTGSRMDDIVFNAPLDEALFRMDPPSGYAVEADIGPRITEGDVIEFMRLTAEFYDGVFPETMPAFNVGTGAKKLSDARKKPADQLKPAEARMLAAIENWMNKLIPGPGPTFEFIRQQVVTGSWQYIGGGVRLGDASRIVCWYRPKGAQTYRVLYGDLSVRDLEAKDLPLPVDIGPSDRN